MISSLIKIDSCNTSIICESIFKRLTDINIHVLFYIVAAIFYESVKFIEIPFGICRFKHELWRSKKKVEQRRLLYGVNLVIEDQKINRCVYGIKKQQKPKNCCQASRFAVFSIAHTSSQITV